MQEPFSDKALDELILIMQMSDYDADVAINQSHDIEEIAALREHKRAVQKWIKHFQQLKAESAARAEDTARRRTQGAKDGWDIRKAKQHKQGG